MRFIPAYAGNARAAKLGRRPSAVHPRIRGERDHSHTFEGVSFGSSPHTRGTHTEAQLKAIHGRFIPAYAGNAAPTHSFCRSVPVHPRIRGERSATAHPVGRSCGSSPHTRGTLSGVALLRLQFRFIPAYAGNAPGKHLCSPRYPVHPRIRGERPNTRRGSRYRRGSSPHTRGTLLACLAGRPVVRFIPAYAGNAPAYPLTVEDGAVHPRIRGERDQLLVCRRGANGSSPHTRGTLVYAPPATRTLRFIPAYAGNAH